MTERGLTEQANLGEKILQNSAGNKSGTALTITMEGNRPLLMEIQALVSTTAFGYPKRMANGIDRNRLELLIAVLEKHTPISLGDQDVYLKVSNGLSLNEPAADLAICAAVVSSFLQIPTRQKLFWGEVDLSGNIRTAPRLEQRSKAGEKLKLSPSSPANDLKTLVSFLSTR